MVVLGTMPVAAAQTITDPDEIASRLHFWAQETGDPVYYGEVRNVGNGQIWVITGAWPLHSSNTKAAYFITLTRCGENRRMGPATMTT